MSRVETGPVKIGDDWTGVFVRGDEAMALAMTVEALLALYHEARSQHALKDIPTAMTVADAEVLIATLRSCHEPVNEHWKVEQLEQTE